MFHRLPFQQQQAGRNNWPKKIIDAINNPGPTILAKKGPYFFFAFTLQVLKGQSLLIN